MWKYLQLSLPAGEFGARYRASSFVESLLWLFNLGMVMIIIDAPPVQYKQPGSRLQGKVPWVQTGCVVFYSLAEL